MVIEHLVASMFEKDFSLLEKSHITENALLINQCDEVGKEEKEVNGKSLRKINSDERGLAKSRNMAIENAMGDICIICDNDAMYEEDYSSKVKEAYETYPDADVIIFRISNKHKRIKEIPHEMKRLELLRCESSQITFKRKSIQDEGIRFDERMGAGTQNGGEEEVKFLMDCHEKLKIYYVPQDLLYMRETESTWFAGYDEKFFENRGMTTRHILGLPMAVLYACYYTIFKYKEYGKDIPAGKAFFATLKGIRENKLGHGKERNK